ncbi:sulfur carrier protein ThiS [Ensifer sp. 2YAB10]|uniref:sulfur carrier protein ThiS n=1 Tax=Ensifer TaxID=106591 RepID=UPI000DE30F0A|nr:sulfur carrier protein ThiS [Ensifer adhaerens]MBZ7926961.1 sulfur carrier protein ThiS [Ensifer adhaerens]UAX96732.1 sulfur carrier protein ThiS [Ensifer adhaerens]UAY03924.1 sulfur carrier protein ThiS [Ensifer adhaerens]UAY11910.1 sulfur carrier protein ThiS [Ensifer adhaerens]
MKLIVNGEDHDLAVANLAELLAALDFEGDWLATAVNGELVHRTDRSAHALNDRDRIEILSPMKGG